MNIEVWIGTYTRDILFGTGEVLHGKGEGIYHLTFNTETQEWQKTVAIHDIENPSFVIQSSDGEYLFAVQETKEYKGLPSGYVSSFKIDKEEKTLTWLSSQPSYGTDPCHLSINSKRTHLFVASFMSGSISMHRITSEGKISDEFYTVAHEGSSIHPMLQKGAHAHAVILSADERFLFVPDLGVDKVFVYEIDYEKTKLVRREDLTYFASQGSGPRAITFHPTLPYAYCINEINSTITLLAYDKRVGKLTPLQSYTTLPEHFSGESSCADIRISSCGSYLLGSNRGHDSLVCFSINSSNGELDYISHTPTGGKCPRNFFISGNTIMVANQDSDNITLFSLDGGKILNLGKSIIVPTPVCVNNRTN